jgi:hypothetical protein
MSRRAGHGRTLVVGRGALLGALLAALLGALAPPLAAQEAAPAPLQVELVVFRHARVDGSPPLVTRTDAAGAPGPAADSLRLRGTVRRLAATGYQPLLHAAWIEPATAGRADRVVTDPALPGLRLRAQAARDGGLRLGVEVEVPGVNGPPLRLTGSRRIRGPGLVYFDHPDFGVLASVSAASPAD